MFRKYNTKIFVILLFQLKLDFLRSTKGASGAFPGGHHFQLMVGFGGHLDGVGGEHRVVLLGKVHRVNGFGATNEQQANEWREQQQRKRKFTKHGIKQERDCLMDSGYRIWARGTTQEGGPLRGM